MRIMMIALVTMSFIGCGDEKAKGNKSPATAPTAQPSQPNAPATAAANQPEIDRLKAENARLQQEIDQLKQQQTANNTASGSTNTGGATSGSTSGLGGLASIAGLLGAVPGLQGCMQSLLQNASSGNLQSSNLQNLGSGCTGIFNQVAGSVTR